MKDLSLKISCGFENKTNDYSITDFLYLCISEANCFFSILDYKFGIEILLFSIPIANAQNIDQIINQIFNQSIHICHFI